MNVKKDLLKVWKQKQPAYVDIGSSSADSCDDENWSKAGHDDDQGVDGDEGVGQPVWDCQHWHFKGGCGVIHDLVWSAEYGMWDLSKYCQAQGQGQGQGQSQSQSQKSKVKTRPWGRVCNGLAHHHHHHHPPTHYNLFDQFQATQEVEILHGSSF